MKSEVKNDISNRIDAQRLTQLMQSGRGKRKERLSLRMDPSREVDCTFDPQSIWDRMKDNTKWKDTELAAVTGIDRQTIGKMRKDNYYSGDRRSTTDTIMKIAEALDVDPEYLTGGQSGKKKRRVSPKEKAEREARSEAVRKGQRLKILSELLKIYSLSMVFDDPITPASYSLYDADGNKIREDESIENIDPLLEMMTNYLRTGSDLISMFFGELWIEEM